MTERPAKRRYRIRRKRRSENIADAGDAAEFGCCLFEAVSVVAVVVGLLLVPVALID